MILAILAILAVTVILVILAILARILEKGSLISKRDCGTGWLRVLT